jgi:hypothetical protein
MWVDGLGRGITVVSEERCRMRSRRSWIEEANFLTRLMGGEGSVACGVARCITATYVKQGFGELERMRGRAVTRIREPGLRTDLEY